MTALVPLNNAEALPRLHEAGVGEVYLGFHDEGWRDRFGAAELNRMSGFGREANPFSLEQACDQIARANALGIRAFVCFNASSYTSEQSEHIRSAYLPQLVHAGARGVILSSQALIGPARNAGLDAVVSTVAGVFNARLARYYAELGATRIILPRDLSIFEIQGIVNAQPQLEYEVFLMRNGCMFSDSHCLGCHRGGRPSLCTSLRTADWSIRLREPAAPAYGGLQAPAGAGEWMPAVGGAWMLAGAGAWMPAGVGPQAPESVGPQAPAVDGSRLSASDGLRVLTGDAPRLSAGAGLWLSAVNVLHAPTYDGPPAPTHDGPQAPAYDGPQAPVDDESLLSEDDAAFLRRARLSEWLLNVRYHRRTCGLCALWRFERLGIAAYKVVGRGDDADDLVQDASLVVQNAQIARQCATEAEYHERMILPRDPQTLCGNKGLSCYYPECAFAPLG